MAMTKTIQATVKNRTDTAANWTQKNPVLAEGEIIVVQTSAGETRLKIGDGVKTFTQLPYTDEQIYNNVVTSVNGETGDVTLPGNFIVNATLTEDETNCTLDKTFAQIREAVTVGNKPVVHFEMPDGSGTAVMPLVEDYGVVFVFRATISIDTGVEALIGQYIISINSDDKVIFKTASALSLNSGGNLTQQTMDRAPTIDMQIATKKYVDDKISDKELILSSSTAGSTKKFKLTIDDTGTLTASEVTA